MSETTTTTTKKPTPSEVADSATGYDERAVVERFGQPLATLQFTDGAMWGRALVFILRRRDEGATDDQAEKAAMEPSIKAVWEDNFLLNGDDEESGKDEPESEKTPESSPLSVS